MLDNHGRPSAARSGDVDVSSIGRIDHVEAMQIAAVENARFTAALRALRPDDWRKPTDCTRWDVQALAAHVTGSARAQASPREFVRQVRAGRPLLAEIGTGAWWDGMNEIQVRERRGLSATELVHEWVTAAPRALDARTKLPRPIARLPLLKLPPPVGRQPLAYLFDIGFTRDLWLHRVDLTRAAGTTFDVDAEHDGRIVADIVAEWSTTHGEPFVLNLSGAAGGRYFNGSGGEEVELDAVEFCRVLAGRSSRGGVLSHSLPL
jgi:uncharacterized protein (TIGR03083 family)